eukprot:4801463-Pyramimonas_sp.AAC.1
MRCEAAPAPLQGRGLRCRARSGILGLSDIACYFPPRPRTSEARGSYECAARLLTAWLAEQLAKVPQRSTPI